MSGPPRGSTRGPYTRHWSTAGVGRGSSTAGGRREKPPRELNPGHENGPRQRERSTGDQRRENRPLSDKHLKRAALLSDGPIIKTLVSSTRGFPRCSWCNQESNLNLFSANEAS